MTARRRRVGSESETGEPQGVIPSTSWKTYAHTGVSNGHPSSAVDLYFDPAMASRDRTKEFATTVRSLQGREMTRVATTAVKDPRRQQNLFKYAEFMVIARTIGKNISSTYSKLEKLTMCKFFL
jgi:syntaxin 5